MHPCFRPRLAGSKHTSVALHRFLFSVKSAGAGFQQFRHGWTSSLQVARLVSLAADGSSCRTRQLVFLRETTHGNRHASGGGATA